MFDTPRAWYAKRSVIRELSRFFALHDPAVQPGRWLEPRAIGFLATLVTEMAEERVGALGPAALASVQGSVITRLTGLRRELIGDRIALLSSLHEPAFVAGCVAAETFLFALRSGRTSAEGRDEMQAELGQIWEEQLGSLSETG